MKLIGIDWEESNRKMMIAEIVSAKNHLEPRRELWFGISNPRLELPILLASFLALTPVYA